MYYILLHTTLRDFVTDPPSVWDVFKVFAVRKHNCKIYKYTKYELILGIKWSNYAILC